MATPFTSHFDIYTFNAIKIFVDALAHRFPQLRISLSSFGFSHSIWRAQTAQTIRTDLHFYSPPTIDRCGCATRKWTALKWISNNSELHRLFECSRPIEINSNNFFLDSLKHKNYNKDYTCCVNCFRVYCSKTQLHGFLNWYIWNTNDYDAIRNGTFGHKFLTI